MTTPITPTVTRARDPVCSVEIDTATAAAKQVYRGTTFYFHSPECAMKFEANPDVFVNPPEVA